MGPGDTLLVYEYLARRGSWFAPDGEFIATLVLPSIGDGAWSRPVGVFDDGSVLAYAERGYVPEDEGRIDEPVLYYRADAEGNVVDSIGRFPVRSYHVRQIPTAGGIALMSVVPAFEPTPAAVLGRNRLHFGFADRFEVAVHMLDGTLERVVRVDRPRAPVTTAERERTLDQYPDSTASGRAYRQAVEDIGIPETMPAHGPMQVDGPGNLWVADFRPLDELGVEYVEVYELVKGW